ncbi:(deoxy)nucleoside triphosphate pyrophosphohydrolase [Cesiribacter andamanensis]|uniref:8-oxo-dGTP diphosphatase n=1 Tax=Cesiribacter andamanensis AMV16 TaxID=1279009 RepID=M7NHK6_9BACT|nr:(deoxy)nucleoside triphosphate pyrophosphohydrolase [Cesiribacter andamanensis]EMR01260.1 CTP pyrophosphohydrolase [Cesiribacter andamanensis AMV16]
MTEVACALIEHNGRVLVAQRGLHKSEGGLWEFPGGKLEPGESPEACIVREIAEELSLQISPYARLAPAIHVYPGKSIRLIPLLCRLHGGKLQLHEHAACQWLLPQELPALAWCPADVPIVEEYIRMRHNPQ